MPSISCKVVNKKGMHARAAATIVATIAKYDCSASLSHGECTAPGDSLLKLLTLNAPQGSSILISVEGPESKAAIEALDELFDLGFGE